MSCVTIVAVDMSSSDHFADNLQRLAALADVSESVVNKWASGERNPSFTSALKFAEIFDVPADRLARADFADLLETDLADADKFRRVEQTIKELTAKFEGKDETVTPIERKSRLQQR